MLKAFALFDSRDPKAHDELRSLWEALLSREDGDRSGYSSGSDSNSVTSSRSNTSSSTTTSSLSHQQGLHNQQRMVTTSSSSTLSPPLPSSVTHTTQLPNAASTFQPKQHKMEMKEENSDVINNDSHGLKQPIKTNGNNTFKQKKNVVSIEKEEDDEPFLGEPLSFSPKRPKIVGSVTTSGSEPKRNINCTKSFNKSRNIVSIVSVDGARGPRTPPSLALDLSMDDDMDDAKSTHSSMEEIGNWDVSSPKTSQPSTPTNSNSNKVFQRLKVDENDENDDDGVGIEDTTTAENSRKQENNTNKKMIKKKTTKPHSRSTQNRKHKKDRVQNQQAKRTQKKPTEDVVDIGELNGWLVDVDEDVDEKKERADSSSAMSPHDNDTVDDADWTNAGFEVDAKPSLVSLAESDGDDTGDEEEVGKRTPKRRQQSTRSRRRGRSRHNQESQSGRFLFTNSVASSLNNADIDDDDLLDFINNECDDDDDDDDDDDGDNDSGDDNYEPF
eukprot:m.49383 g.49383  ORF g.49383 m.49383 type:complete len:499 (+) comp10862_c0_seq3:80-1576(+)